MSGLGFTHWSASAAIAFGVSFCTVDYAIAQITPDGTLPNNSSVTQDGKTFGITGGTQVGGNLFHSFKEFSIRTGDTAFFNNITAIENIFSRVTGKSVSNIDGLIRANGTANLFLINPNGIIFGPNASLNINGSFVGTTANAIGLTNGDIFSINPLEPIPTRLLNINPSAFFFNQIAAPITVKSRKVVGTGLTFSSIYVDDLKPIYEGLKVPNGQSLLLVGGDVNLDGGVLQAPGGQVDLGGALSSGTIGLNVDGNNLRLSFPNDTARANVSLTNEALVDVIAGDGGSITINARNLGIFKSSLTAGIGEDLGTIGSQAGDITLNATESVRIGQESPIRTSLIINYAQSNAIGKTGDINIKAGSFFAIDSAVLLTENFGMGDSGNISMEASANSSLVNTSILTISSKGDSGDFLVKVNGDLSFLDYSDPSFPLNNFIFTDTFGKGDAGDISIYANGNVTFADTSIGSPASGVKDSTGRGFPKQGNAGSISIQANGNIYFANSSNIDSSTTGEGDAGSVSIQANGNVAFSDNSDISSYTRAEGNAGNVFIQADSNVSFTDNSDIFSYTTGEGNAGNVSIQADINVSFIDTSRISSYTDGSGNAANISVQANGDVSFVNSFITSNTFDEGKGGDIQIQARSISLTEGAEFLATTQGSKNAGNIQIEAKDFVTLSGVSVKGFSSGLFTNTNEGASAQGGNITVRTGALNILDGAVLSARSRTDFDGGDITVDVNTLKISGGGQILTTAFDAGNAGSINVNATDNITLSGSDPTYFERLDEFGSFIVDPVSPASGLFSNTNETSTGAGGDLRIRTDQLNVRDGAEINVSSAGERSAGSLFIDANSIYLNNAAKITADTTGGGGNIFVRSPLLLLRNQSSITTNAKGPGIPGGNITIDALDGFIIAVPQENSDISANSVDFRGGKVEISAQGIFGIQRRNTLTPESDITATGASPEFSGSVELNTPDIDPNSGLIALPTVAVDTQIAQGCYSPGYAQNSFIITGRGGLPPNPREAFSSNIVRPEWATLGPSNDINSQQTIKENPPISTPPAPIVEATGWGTNTKGEIVLTANASTGTPHSNWQQSPVTCSSAKSADN